MSLCDEQIAAWLHGSLDAEEAARVAALIGGDSELAARADRLHQLDELVRQAVPLEDPLPDAVLVRLGLATPANSADIVDLAAARLARAEAPAAQPTRFSALASGGWRVAAQVLIVLGLGFGASLWIGAQGQPGPEGEYRTLGSAQSAEASANALLMFDESIDIGEANALIATVDARKIGQPTPAGVWRLQIEPARRDAALATLRARPGVRMAEAIDGTVQ